MVSERSLARWALLAFLATSLAPAVATAEPNPSDRETARRLMAEGEKQRAAGDLEQATKRFAEAHAIMQLPTTGLELARTLATNGKLVEARDTLVRSLLLPPVAGEPPQLAAAREQSVALSAALASRIAALTIRVADPATGNVSELMLDGEPVAVATLGVARSVNPGHHTIVAKRGEAAGRVEVDLAEGEKAEAVITFEGVKPALPPPASTPVRVLPAAQAGSGSTSAARIALYGGVAVAVVAASVGAVAGVVTLSKKSALDNACLGGECPASAMSDYDAARTARLVSDVAFVVAGVGAAAAVTGFLLGRGATTTAPPVARRGAELVWSPTSFGVRGRF